MNHIFAPYLRKFILVLFDDILIYSKSMQEHASHLAQVLSTFREHRLTTKRSKCVFATTTVAYLGHVIHGNGVATDPTKIEAIQTWQIPQSITQLRSFLSLVGYYMIYKTLWSYMQDTSSPSEKRWISMGTKPHICLQPVKA
jgi:hypothetical protein